jgi:GNAT superfamily N-acetyltransferase
MDPAAEGLSIDAATADDLAVVALLAGVIWRRHYPGIITHEQIDYMLARGYAEPALRPFLEAPGAGLAIARAHGEPVGFAAWCRAEEAGVTKLDKLYVLQQLHGRGAGRRLIGHVEAAARADGASTLVLNVNKHNASSIGFYRRCGFEVRESVVVDIGRGFVMDDYVMAKPIGAATGHDLR